MSTTAATSTERRDTPPNEGSATSGERLVRQMRRYGLSLPAMVASFSVARYALIAYFVTDADRQIWREIAASSDAGACWREHLGTRYERSSCSPSGTPLRRNSCAARCVLARDYRSGLTGNRPIDTCRS